LYGRRQPEQRREDVMKGVVRTVALMLLAGSLVFPGTAAAGADELCPMGGTMVKIAVDKDKAVEWLEDERRAFLLNEDAAWELKTLSDASDKIALVLTEEYVYFGVADDRDDREADERRMSKAFGNGNKLLRGAVQKEIKAMWKAQIIDIGGSEVQEISEAVDIGTLSNDGRDWVFEAGDCDPLTVNLEELD
jgi:hypothetical protein